MAMPTSTHTESRLQADSKAPTLRKILIVTDNKKAVEPLAEQLQGHKFEVELAFYNGKTLSNTPTQSPCAIIFDLNNYEEKSTDIARVLKSHYARSCPPLIAVLSKTNTLRRSVFDSLIIKPAHVSQIANRVTAYLRLSAMEREITLRKATLEHDFGKTVSIYDDGQYPSFKVLFIGKANPSFMVIMNALQKKNVEVIAAFTSFSAFDYLHDGSFDAVVMNTIEEPEPAISIAETMRRNSRLYHVPTLFITKNNEFEYIEKVHKKGASDIIDIQSDPEEISGRILELANYHRLQENLKEEFQNLGDETTLVPSNKCYNKAFMDQHSQRVVHTNKHSAQPLTFLAVKLLPHCKSQADNQKIYAAISDIGKILKNLVRMQDTVSFYDHDVYLLMLPNTSTFDAKVIVDRFNALINCTAFDSGNSQSPLTMTMDYSVITVSKDGNASGTLSRCLSELEHPTSNVSFRNSA